MDDLGQFSGAVARREQGGKEVRAHPLRLAEARAMHDAGILAEAFGELRQIEGGGRADIFPEIAKIAAQAFEEGFRAREGCFRTRKEQPAICCTNAVGIGIDGAVEIVRAAVFQPGLGVARLLGGARTELDDGSAGEMGGHVIARQELLRGRVVVDADHDQRTGLHGL